MTEAGQNGPEVIRVGRRREMLCCQHCGAILGRDDGERIRVRVRGVLAFRRETSKSLDRKGMVEATEAIAEVNCPTCGKDTSLPAIRFKLRGDGD